MPSDMLLFVIVSSAICLGSMVVLWRMAPSVTEESREASESAPSPPAEPEAPAAITLNTLLLLGLSLLIDAGLFPLVWGAIPLYKALRPHPRKVAILLAALTTALVAGYLLVRDKDPQPLWLGTIYLTTGLLLYTAQFPQWKTLHSRLLPLLLAAAIFAWAFFSAPVHAVLLAAWALIPPAVHLLRYRRY